MNVIRDADCTKDMPVIHGYPEKPIFGTWLKIRPRLMGKRETPYDKKIFLPELLPLEDYDHIIVLFSGGKDSTAAYYKLRELGVPKKRIELWHHDVDGGHPTRKMDWPVTKNYVRSFAKAEGVRLRVSDRANGFWGEVYRIGASYPIEYENDDGNIVTCRLSKKQLDSQRIREEIMQVLEPQEYDALKEYGYRMKFPAKSGDLSRRWCSACLKIDVATAVVRNLSILEGQGFARKFPAKGSIAQGRYCSPQLKREVADKVLRNIRELRKIGQRGKFPAKSGCHQGRWCSGTLKAEVQSGVTSNINTMREKTKILIVSGERRGESSGRAKYNEMEVHRTNATARAGRLVHQWRNVIDLTEKDVWEVLRRHKVWPHPCYKCGWNRCSCMLCIFSLPTHWAGIRELFPEEYEAVCRDEKILGFTLDSKKTLSEYVGSAKSCVKHNEVKALYQLTSGHFTVNDVYTKNWDYPAGAFKGAEGGPC